MARVERKDRVVGGIPRIVLSRVSTTTEVWHVAVMRNGSDMPSDAWGHIRRCSGDSSWLVELEHDFTFPHDMDTFYVTGLAVFQSESSAIAFAVKKAAEAFDDSGRRGGLASAVCLFDLQSIP